MFTSCPNWATIDYATNWINPTSSSPDYFNTVNGGQHGIPTNDGGFEFAHTGNAYGGVSPFFFWPGVNDYREYIQVPLDSSLKKNEIYCVEFYVSLGDTSEYAVNNIGAYFSTSAVSSTNYQPLPYSPQIINTSSNPLTDMIGWTKVAGQFVAQGGEQYLTIGNFNDNATTDTVLVISRSPSDKLSYYYIDDVSVIHLDADAGNDTAICQGGNILLGRPASAGLSYSWQPATGLSNDTIAQPIATPNITTTYYLTATLNGGCSKQDTVTVTIIDANAGNDTTLCYASSAIIGMPAQVNVNYTWQPTAGLNNAGIAQPTATPLTTTTYTVTATTNGCSITDSVTLNVLQNISSNAGTDVTIMLGTNTTLTAGAIAGSTFSWSPSAYLSCDTCASTIASPTNTTAYILTASLNSCSSSDTVIVYVDTDCGELFVPNVFSPNGDGANDFLNVYGNCITAIDFLIFDRWGEKVFESTDLNIGWDGTYKGSKLDDAVFIYYLNATVNGIEVKKHGSISIVR